MELVCVSVAVEVMGLHLWPVVILESGDGVVVRD
jgi:hypothetical protein